MDLPQVNEVKTADEAEQLAIDWQQWASEQDLSYGELIQWQRCFENLGEQFNLTDEFKENGII